MRQEEKKTIQAAVLGAVLFLLIQIFRTPLSQIENQDVMLALYLIIGCCNIAFGFAIFAQGSLFFSDTLSKSRLYISALFLGVCIFDFLHTLSFVGIPAISSIISPDQSLWLLTISRLASAFGILFIFSKEDEPVSVRGKKKVLTVSLVVIALSLLVLVFSDVLTPGLQAYSWLGTVKHLVDMAVLLIYLLSVGMIVYPGRIEKSASMLIIIRALIFFALAQVFFMNLLSVGEMDNLFGMLSSGIAYYLMLTGVYRLTIEEPFHENQQAEARINYLAYHDDLTGLPNRRQLMQRVEEMMARTEKAKGHSGFSAVVIMNINHFKNINDSLGHYAGDLLLKLVAQRILNEVKTHEELFSMGADEFAFLMTERTGVESCLVRASKLLQLFETPVQLESGEYHISLSLGMSIYPGDGNTAEQLIQNADTAVHNAKEQNVEIRRYIPSMQMKAKERLKLENDLRRALERNEFYLVYQPQVQLETEEIVGMEALLRWEHPKRGIVSPVEFIPIAEESGLIVPIGDWVLRTACQQNKEWQLAGYRHICVSINLSMRQFLQPNLAGKIDALLQEIGLDPCYVDLEITESMTLDKETAFDQLNRLKRLGVFISIDDFGTGYSSLHYLKNMPIDRLKIDRSFVSDVMEDSNNAAIVSTITSMAHHLKLKVTAEGVENKEQLHFLRQQHCHEAQGYLFSKPIKAAEFEAVFLKPLLGISVQM
ncbi:MULTISPECIES: EAL domain-containing protein [unclassified Paenibacillus]|uniref:putative bifunctional diguanylate cyclase/phosphodiesterase n=1 Tax=unclassified Paenibacillus TaxID=185978 RepID=UPI002406BB77|nr:MULTISPECIES: EAL domain-containing protein [unclassified Paenibacillus]MDF9843533.1 diguanylate cyclase (GGDEF)-like protein [Paenibacillus sp. PastF-2]MDF9850121.1 diguanylate cyclase (GGDEF)-like protein [Paenibacillus sp. PastM-2]MDF9857137.1 diguanylate cyclase (GGDEF)-like protein [Paenibacillus sp. PastF-1]MDH6482408.1 diguanylate cyclase (GGDEF)-like protein [Paenibacillus sp. PastH-2]MDH6509254.1 diguanylate cyclase (GGDEF)-like protein [Paenibacillus sp. PastM-3]